MQSDPYGGNTTEVEREALVPNRGARRRRLIAAVVVGVVILLGIGFWLLRSNGSDDGEEAAATETTQAAPRVVSDSDEVVTPIPQEPSLNMSVDDGTLMIENDGNVTMSDVEVRDSGGSAVCVLGVLSPGDRVPCEEAGGATDLSVVGVGPQGQEVEVALS